MMERGDRVMATSEIDMGFFGQNIEKGEVGAVVEVHEGMFSDVTYTVAFKDGKQTQVKESQVVAI